MNPTELRAITIAISNAIMQLLPDNEIKFHLAVFDADCTAMVSATNSSCEHCMAKLIDEFSSTIPCISEEAQFINLPETKIN